MTNSSILRSAMVWLGFATPEPLSINAHNHSGGPHHVFGSPHGHSHGLIDPTITTTERGIWAIKWSFTILAITSALQLGVAIASGSVALLADTIHNVGDAATAVPLWIAFRLVRRKPPERFTYGLGRVEDLAGVTIVVIILVSAMVAGWEALARLFHPQPVGHLWAVAAAGAAGFIGNESVAVFRIRVGREIESAALVADGYHARTDGLTSLAVVVGAAGVWLGFPLADPIVGLVITVAILAVVWQSTKAVFTRLLDGVEPGVARQIRHAAEHVAAVRKVLEVRVRWLGHRLTAEVDVAIDGNVSVSTAEAVSESVEHALLDHMAALSIAHVRVRPDTKSPADDGHEHGEESQHYD